MSRITLTIAHADYDSAEMQCVNMAEALRVAYLIADSGTAQVQVYRGQGYDVEYLGCLYRSLTGKTVLCEAADNSVPASLDNDRCDPFGWVASN